MSLAIVYRDIDDIHPHPENPKGHDLPTLEASVERFGWTTPLLVCGRTDLLAAGHGRLELTQLLRDRGEPPPTNVTVDDDGTWRLPVITGWDSTDDVELKAYVVADNAIGPRGGWINDRLGALLQEVVNTPRGLVGVGLDMDDLDTLLADLGTGELPDLPTDAAYADRPERGEPGTPRTVQGLHEVGLMFKDEQHSRYLQCLAQLRALWGHDLPSPDVVVRAMELAADRG